MAPFPPARFGATNGFCWLPHLAGAPKTPSISRPFLSSARLHCMNDISEVCMENEPSRPALKHWVPEKFQELISCGKYASHTASLDAVCRAGLP